MSGPIITGAAIFKLREGIPPDERAAAVVGVVSAAVFGFPVDRLPAALLAAQHADVCS